MPSGVYVRTPQARENLKKANQKKAQDPVWIENKKIAGQKMAQDPVWIENKKIAGQKLAQNPMWRENIKKANQKKAQDPVWRETLKKANQKQSQDPLWRERTKIAGQKRSQDPVWRENHKKAKQKQAQDPVWREKLVGGFWIGNVQYHEYIACEKWRLVNPRTKAYHGYRCVWCGQDIHKGLTGHHVFYEKQACCLLEPETGVYYTKLNVKKHKDPDYEIGVNPNYFVPLCRECHGETGGDFENRAMWADRLRELVDITGKCYFVIGKEDDLYHAFKKKSTIPTIGFTGTPEYQEMIK